MSGGALKKNEKMPALLIIDVQTGISLYPPREKELAFFFINLLIDLFGSMDSQ
jgi:hypothetical protein